MRLGGYPTHPVTPHYPPSFFHTWSDFGVRSLHLNRMPAEDTKVLTNREDSEIAKVCLKSTNCLLNYKFTNKILKHACMGARSV